MGKNQDPDPGSGSGMNIQEHISESLKTIFWDKFFDADPGIFLTLDPGCKTRIRDKHTGSATLGYHCVASSQQDR
jgi:hypothetical protein